MLREQIRAFAAYNHKGYFSVCHDPIVYEKYKNCLLLRNSFVEGPKDISDELNCDRTPLISDESK